MTDPHYDVVIIGGSFAGLSAAMTLGRSLRDVLIIDSGKPCNRQTPASHNVITMDGEKPAALLNRAREQVLFYNTVGIMNDEVRFVKKKTTEFEVQVGDGKVITSRKIILANGIKDIMPEVSGFEDCWGISVLHCPYCHGYEVKGKKTGVLANGEMAFEFAKMIHHWTPELTLFTNGISTLTNEQELTLKSHNIAIVQSRLVEIIHKKGHLSKLVFDDGTGIPLEALYTRLAFEQHLQIPQLLSCRLNEGGYIEVDQLQKTSVPGVFAAGDNTNPFRSVSGAIAAGSMAGAALNKELIEEDF
ncbi:Thioredoxin reductase [Fulvivirga imtechensis AK7]|uniref:Thioredoxin reductase n=1 Tax=Fulvivirga imtechensis AK7 TaxID=1237149 RepID=L8JW60_9BACT|nr:NAD(P)/FAD-dependent oxidoreductase [Fulvivirga imtechensis]ELR73040.1 Thioredoxin reductase [Fulvivirga imtechensis AK7]